MAPKRLQELMSRQVLTKHPRHFGGIVGNNCGLASGVGHGNIAKAGVEQVGVDASIGVDRYALRNEPLANSEARTQPAQKEYFDYHPDFG